MSAPSFRYANESLRCSEVKPNEHVTSSTDAGWTSLLVDVHRATGTSDVFETSPTPDVTLVVAMRGIHRLEVSKEGHWRSAVYRVGASGMTAPTETARLRWSSLPGDGTFETAHIYLPAALVELVDEEYRNTGRQTASPSLSSLVFQDPVVMSVATGLVQGMHLGLPDLYAEQAGHWLVTHLLGQHAGWWNLDEDHRQPAVICDKRFARVLDYMSAHLATPLNLTELAREAGISVHHFGRRFRERLGMTPLAYVTDLRMREARRLLRGTNFPVSHVAAACGYGRAAAFSAAYHRHFGQTPRETRLSAGMSRDRET
jgi:AraC family transcriptional regulator